MGRYATYRIKYGAMEQFYGIVSKTVDDWFREIEGLSRSYETIIRMKSYQGKSAEAVKAYLSEVHGVLLYAIQQALTAYQTELLLYKTGYYNIENNYYASMPEEILEHVQSKLKAEESTLESIASSIRSSLNNVSDILPLSIPACTVLQGTFEGLKNDLAGYDAAIDHYESQKYASYLSDLKKVIDTLQRAIGEYLYSKESIAKYYTGAISSSVNMLELYENVQKCSERAAGNPDAVQIALEKQTEVYEQMQADYEAACEARKDAGGTKIIMGLVEAVAGIAAIYLTAGAATPVVVTAAVTGSCTTFYGVSNISEGRKERQYGYIGDLDSKAFNPIRDTIFVGNQGVYDAWGSLNMAVAGMCIPVGHAVNGVAGASKDVIAKATIKTVGKEILKDQVFDYASGNITQYATEKWLLNRTESTLLNLGLSAGLDFGSDMVDQKIHGKPFTDGMSYEDAKRYNAYNRELEAGIHNPHPGMSVEDVGRWKLAEGKVNEHIAVSKVDTDAVLGVRLKELEIQRNLANGAGTKAVAGESGSKSISYMDYDNIYQKSIHNVGKDKVMLGKYDGGGPTSYINKAGDDYTYFNLGKDWDSIKEKYGFTDDDMFKLFNESFLDDGINGGKTFYFSHNPINDRGALGIEYEYLLKNNYIWDEATMTMKPR